MSQEQDCHNDLWYKACFNPEVALLLVREQAAQQSISPVMGQGCNFPLSLKDDVWLTAIQPLCWLFPFLA